MTTITKSRFARRSLVLCGVAGAAVIWLMLTLVNLQLVSPRKTGGVPSGGIIEREVLLPQRGRIMDANEEILTNNMQSSELIADGYHLNDPKTISWALAYSKAVHSAFLLAACPRILLRKPETSFSFSLSVAASPQKAEWTALE